MTAQEVAQVCAEVCAEIWARQEAREARLYGRPEDRAPSDAEIVAAYSAFIAGSDRHQLRAGGIHVGYAVISMADCRAAWSRELHHKQREAREVERHRIIVQDQYEP